MEVELDEASLEKLAKRWQEASYPSLAGGGDASPREASEAVEAVAGAQDDGSESDRDDDTAAEPSGLLIDPQLRRAVESLRQAIPREAETTAAA
jgi:hypothetical protein